MGDVCREGTYLGLHTEAVVLGLRWGIVLFIISEVIFFFSFFWAFFHSSLSPNIELGCQWPPIGIKRFRPFGVPLINTFILLTSGLTVTVSHVAIVLEEINFDRQKLTLFVIHFFLDLIYP